MKLHIQSVHCAVESNLLEQLRLKLYKLVKRHECIHEADVYLIEEGHGDGRNKLVEMLLRINEFDLFIKERAFTFEDAAMGAIEGIEHQLNKHQEQELAYC